MIDTLQLQYTRGPLRIAQWAHLTNAHLLPGPSIIPSLKSAALETLTNLNQSVATTISSDATLEPTPSIPNSTSAPYEPLHNHSSSNTAIATTTISQTVESTSTSQPPSLLKSLSHVSDDEDIPDTASALETLGPPPHARGLLLLAQMSSAGNLCTLDYTGACIAAAKENQDFVLGFIGQGALSEEPGLLTFCPGVNLPKESTHTGEKTGDGKGQVWRTPETVVGEDGVDVIIVGRGILGADDRREEAERYRKAAWEAYEKRIA